MSKIIVTHENPDLDAIGAVWLWRRFGGNQYKNAEVMFVSAGETLSEKKMAELKVKMDDVVHVDTGLGQFDHHQPERNMGMGTSAARLVHEYLEDCDVRIKDDEALARVVDFINDTDHFASCLWPDATADKYLFMMEEILNGLRYKGFNDRELIEFGSLCLDGVYSVMRLRVRAEKDIKELGQEFKCKWGKALAIENKNGEVIKLALKQGYKLAVQKSQDSGHVRIKAAPGEAIDLTQIYKRIKAIDNKGTWYFHPAKTMVLNGSTKNSKQIATKLTLKEVAEIIENE